MGARSIRPRIRTSSPLWPGPIQLTSWHGHGCRGGVDGSVKMSILSFSIFLSGTVYISTIPTSKAIGPHITVVQPPFGAPKTDWWQSESIRILSTSRLMTWTSTLALNLESTNLDGGNLPMVSNDIVVHVFHMFTASLLVVRQVGW